MRFILVTLSLLLSSLSFAGAGAEDGGLCLDAGPQTPRDITSTYGENQVRFPVAPPANEMNLCNIHTHTNAEHKGPGFNVFVSDKDDGGYACNAASSLTEAELAMYEQTKAKVLTPNCAFWLENGHHTFDEDWYRK